MGPTKTRKVNKIKAQTRSKPTTDECDLLHYVMEEQKVKIKQYSFSDKKIVISVGNKNW